MSNYMPSVQIKILCRLPVKSLIRFRSVSKEWKSLIDSSEFNSNYFVHQDQRRRLLLWGGEYDEYCWIVDDDDLFPQHKISLRYHMVFNRQLNINQIKFVGSSYGLLCFTRRYLSGGDYLNRYVIWNPEIRKSVVIDALHYKRINVGFGVCPNTLDPKIVKINIIKVSKEHARYDDDLQQYI
ncbi:putative F-box protein At1g50870 [Rutidosis leptorrhynchoides]|uniref:putative F-box protein At1g50870 n=1 Tax=Rutidosis leptorrhynchoides TaxID=125765 RepID=UPI003A9A2312